MAQKKIINKVKTESGYDSLFPLTPYQIHYANSVTQTSSKITVAIDFLDSEITSPILVCFSPLNNNVANVTFQVNSLDAYPLYLNNTLISTSQITSSDTVLVLYDTTNQKATILAVSSFAKLKKATSSQATVGTDDTTYMTPLRTKDAIASSFSTNISIKTGTISDDGTIPQTVGFAHYVYFVSPNDIESPTTVQLPSGLVSLRSKVGIKCSVDQTTRKVTCKMGLGFSISGTASIDWVSGTANYLELAWN